MRVLICLISVFFLKQAFSQSLSDGLVAKYTFNNTAKDESGHNQHGQIHGNVVPEADRFGNPCGAYRFLGKGSYITVLNSTWLQAPENSITITAWVKPEKRGEGANDIHLPLLSKKDPDSAKGIQPQYAFQLKRGFGDSYSTISLGSNFSFEDKQYNHHPIEFGRWYFIALTYDERFVTLYIDGKVIAMAPKQEPFVVNSQPLVIGRGMNDETYFTGCLDDLRIYRRGLSFAEVDRLYNDSTEKNHVGEISYSFPSNITKNAAKGTCSAKVFYVEPTISTGCNTEVLKQIQGSPSGSDFTVGTTKVVYQTKIGEAQLQDSFLITVKDIEPPVFNCVTDIHLYALPEAKKVQVVYPELQVTDNCPKLKIELMEGVVSGDSVHLGLTKISYKATDASGNVSMCNFNVNVTAATAPAVEKKLIAEKKTEPTNAVIAKQKENSSVENKAAAGKKSETTTPNLTPLAGSTKSDIKEKEIATIPEHSTNETALPATAEITNRDNNTMKHHFVCPADTLILLPPNRKGIVYHYRDFSGQKFYDLDSIVKLAGPVNGCFLELGVHPFIYKTYGASGGITNCTYSVIIKADNQAKPYAPPVQLQADLHLGADSVRYEHKAKINNCDLTVVIYDDGEQDNDTVSIVFNGAVIFNRDMIKIKENGCFIKQITLAPDAENYIIAKAWNTGRYGLNTLRIDVFEGSASLSNQDLKKRKPLTSKILHSKPGVASGMLLQCN